ncbi:MAG: hypothetical protein R2799_16230 [Crocinitomicaceae bacterium]
MKGKKVNRGKIIYKYSNFDRSVFQVLGVLIFAIFSTAISFTLDGFYLVLSILISIGSYAYVFVTILNSKRIEIYEKEIIIKGNYRNLKYVINDRDFKEVKIVLDEFIDEDSAYDVNFVFKIVFKGEDLGEFKNDNKYGLSRLYHKTKDLGISWIIPSSRVKEFHEDYSKYQERLRIKAKNYWRRSPN